MAFKATDFSGRVALVTGGSRGIGRAVALALARAGADVGINCRERVEAAERVADEIRALGRRVSVVAADVSLRQPVEELAARVVRGLGSVDILVNNAGIAPMRSIEQLDEAVFDRTLAVNLKSAFLCTQAVLPSMRARRWGRIVNISSVAARGPGGIGVHYNAAKAGLEGLTRGYAAQVAREGITVNAVAPGPVETEMAEPLKQLDVVRRIPVGRFADPDEIAQAVLMVMGNALITGQTLAVNGGMLFV